MPEIEIINIKWDGPWNPRDVYTKTKESDKGVYQVYGDHPVYGLDVLFYIGMTLRTFADRIREHEFEGYNQPIQIYLGRIYLDPTDRRWRNRMIKRAEKILIPACWPAGNSHHITGNANYDDVKDLLILNWGKFRSLPAAVSGRQAGIGDLDDNFGPIGG